MKNKVWCLIMDFHCDHAKFANHVKFANTLLIDRNSEQRLKKEMEEDALIDEPSFEYFRYKMIQKLEVIIVGGPEMVAVVRI